MTQPNYAVKGRLLDYGRAETKLLPIFEKELKAIYWIEKHMAKAVLKLAKNASNAELILAINAHRVDTEVHIEKVESIFKIIGKTATPKKCFAVENLVNEAFDLIENNWDHLVCDTIIINTLQKIEHLEISSYNTLITYATCLGMDEVTVLTKDILMEETAQDETLTMLAESIIESATAYD